MTKAMQARYDEAKAFLAKYPTVKRCVLLKYDGKWHMHTEALLDMILMTKRI